MAAAVGTPTAHQHVQAARVDEPQLAEVDDDRASVRGRLRERIGELRRGLAVELPVQRDDLAVDERSDRDIEPDFLHTLPFHR